MRVRLGDLTRVLLLASRRCYDLLNPTAAIDTVVYTGPLLREVFAK